MASSLQHEPTMEEILASIRKIISEDAIEAPPPAPVASARAPIEPDVLELTQEVPEEPAPTPPAPPPLPSAIPLAPAPAIDDDIEVQTVEEPEPVAPDDDIFSPGTRKALDDTFANIEEGDFENAPAFKQVPPSAGSGSSVEAVFERAVTTAFDPVLHEWMEKNKTDLLTSVKPIIREWMDQNFPTLLQNAVRSEVERVVKARGNKR